MSRKVWLGVAMLATGVTLLVAAGFAAGATSGVKSAHSKTGLAMNLDMSNSDFDYLDPALAYLNVSWQMRYLTDCKLLNYPDKGAPQGTVLQPEAADFPVISKGGTVYTFTIKSNAGGCKFNTGEAVTAQSFADAINRDLNPPMQSPAVQFLERHRRCKRCCGRKGDHRFGRRGQRQQAHDHADQAGVPTSSAGSRCRSSRRSRTACRSTRRARRHSPRRVRTT